MYACMHAVLKVLIFMPKLVVKLLNWLLCFVSGELKHNEISEKV